VEELIEAIAQTYIEYTAPLIYLMEKVTESRQKGNHLSPAQLDDFVEEATSSTFNIFSLRTLLSSLKDTDMGKAGNSSSRFINQFIKEPALTLLRDNMARSTASLIKDYAAAIGSGKDIDKALKRASHAICIELSRIKDLNRGILPHPDLEDLWERFSCKDDFAALDLM